MIEVLHDHQVVGQHPEGSMGAVDAAGQLVITEPGPAAVAHPYPHGAWHAWGDGIVCAWLTPDPNCPRCFPPAMRPA